MRASKNADPGQLFVRTMMSLYFTDKVGPTSGEREAETLPPMEALVLGMMCLNRVFSAQALSNRLFSYKMFDSAECDILTEAGILKLMEFGYLRPASRRAQVALQNRNDRVWGLGDVPFIVTAKGAKRIAFLVGNLTGENVKEVVKRLQAESKEKAKAWVGLVAD